MGGVIIVILIAGGIGLYVVYKTNKNKKEEEEIVIDQKKLIIESREDIESCDKAIEIDSKDVVAWTEKSRLLMLLADAETEALFWSSHLAGDKINETDLPEHKEKDLNRYREALEACKKALEIKPMDDDAKELKKYAQAHIDGTGRHPVGDTSTRRIIMNGRAGIRSIESR